MNNNSINPAFSNVPTGFPGTPNNVNNNVGSPLFTQNGVQTPNQSTAPEIQLPSEESYIENILRVNRGKKVEIYMTFTDSTEWRDRVFSGILEIAGRDHIILSDPTDGKWYLLPMIYLDYVRFDEKIFYSPQFLPSIR